VAAKRGVAAYDQTGALDPGFGSGGLATTSVSPDGSGANALAIEGSGAIIAAGRSAAADGRSNFALVGYRPDGSLDSAFGSAGVATTDFNSDGNDFIHAIALDRSGRIVAGGDTAKRSKDFALARYRSNGVLDRSFGSGGRVTTPFAPPLPTTRVTSTKISHRKRKAVFTFNGSGVGMLFFECRLDQRKFKPCPGPDRKRVAGPQSQRAHLRRQDLGRRRRCRSDPGQAEVPDLGESKDPRRRGPMSFGALAGLDWKAQRGGRCR
jgi:uncharacterized delta-60 repeat protein